MSELASTPAPAVTRWHGWLDVKKGITYHHARVPVAVEVADRELRITVTERQLGRNERLALSELGDDVLGKVLTGREPYVLALPLADTKITFPRMPGRRAAFIAERDGLPAVGVNLLDIGDQQRSSPWRILYRIVTRAAEARRTRERVRAAIEAERAVATGA